MKFVNIVAGGFMLIAISGYPVPHLILHDQHAKLFQLLTQVLDIETDDSIIQLYIGLMVEYVQGTIDIDLQGCGDALCLRLRLLPEDVIQISQDRHILRSWILEVPLIHNREASVDDRLFFRFDAAAASHDQLAQRQDEVRLEPQRVIVIGVIQIDIHRIDIVLAGRGNMNHLSAQRQHQCIILGLRIADDDVIHRHQKCIQYLPLPCEGLTGSRRTENQPIRILQLLPIHHDHVAGKRVEPVVECFASHEQFLRGKRNEDRQR